MPPSKTSATRRLKRIALLLIATLTAFVLAEITLRVRQKIKYGTAAMTVHEFEIHPASGLRIPVAGMVRRGIAINSLGFRGPELTQPKPAGLVRLAFLGGSTTFCAEVSSEEASWPHLVVDMLSERFPHAKFDYVNAGVPGYTTDDSLLNLEHRVKPLLPDVIVICHASNDLSRDTRELALDQGLFEGKAEDPTFLARISLFWYLAEKNFQILLRQKAASGGVARLRFDPQSLAEGFRERIAELVDASMTSARVVALCIYPHKVRREQSYNERLRTANTSLYYMPYMSVDGILDGFGAYNRVIRNVASEKNIILAGNEYAIPGDDLHFVDSVHFTDLGSQIMATEVFDALVEAKEFRELLER